MTENSSTKKLVFPVGKTRPVQDIEQMKDNLKN
jgi:hypothetical protein